MADGFLGTSASIMLDVVLCSLLLVIPLLAFSIYLVRWRKNYVWHKRVQVTLGLVLLVVVSLFEIDMRLQGGFWEMAKDSPYVAEDGDGWKFIFPGLLYVHLTFSISTVVLWAATLILALWQFPNPPHPSAFSPTHRAMAWIAVCDMVATAVTGVMVYYFGFWVTGSE